MRRTTVHAVCHRRGVTLVEVVLSSLVLAVVASGGLRVLVSVVDRRELAVRVAVGSQLADQLLSEAVSRPFTSPGITRNSQFGPSATEAAQAAGSGWGVFDDCDDFEGWESTPPQSSDGTALAGFDSWTRRVGVAWVTTTDRVTSVAGPTSVKRITVEVEFQGKLVATRVGYRTEAGQRMVEAR